MNTFKDLSIAVLPFAFWFTLFCKAMGRWVDRKWYSGDIGGIGTFVMTLKFSLICENDQTRTSKETETVGIHVPLLQSHRVYSTQLPAWRS